MSLNVLIVDDSVTVRAVIAKTLQLAQIPVQTLFQAADGQEGLEIIEQQWVDLVFADLHMPRMTGMELVDCMARRGLLAGTPVIIVSSEGSNDRIEELKEKGIRAYIRKPFSPEQLREVVKSVVGEVS